ncbi:unnamed protein product [Symbiodinium pilosum]|uniref:Uncharacterized protein n=1 Tax=Symbiodinium pilosum TaxID=2952 RepID=A0A812WB28_SYMPI|nr:unnamed protein product [Symbiodinium pilosum]
MTAVMRSLAFLLPELCKDIFHELLEAGALPLPLTQETGVPPESGTLIDSVVEDVYAGHIELPPPAAKGKGPVAQSRPKSAAAPVSNVYKDSPYKASSQPNWQHQGAQKRPLEQSFGGKGGTRNGHGAHKWPRNGSQPVPSRGHPLCTQQEDCIGHAGSVLVQHVANDVAGDLYCTHCWAVFADADVSLEALPYEA